MNDRKIAVVGATGNVGRTIISILHERGFLAENISAVASDRSAGQQISFGDNHVLKVQPLSTFNFKGIDIGLFSPGGVVSSQYVPKATEQGCVVIDNTSHFRMDPDVPLVIPEVNGAALADYTKKRIISNPNCSVIQMLVALKPLHDMARIKRIVVSTYQSVSGAGKTAMDELFHQTKGSFVHQLVEPHFFSKQIAFNVIPQIDNFMEDGSTKEEWKTVVETKKILDPSIEVVATCVRVPVFIGHAVSATVEFHDPITSSQARQRLRTAPGVVVVDKPEDYGFITPVECAGDDAVFVSRIRQDPTVPHGLSLWIVSDNVRKGAALNTVQIAQDLIETYL